MAELNVVASLTQRIFFKDLLNNLSTEVSLVLQLIQLSRKVRCYAVTIFGWTRSLFQIDIILGIMRLFTLNKFFWGKMPDTVTAYNLARGNLGLPKITQLSWPIGTFLRHLSNIECLTVHTACLACFISTVNGHSNKKGLNCGASSGHITNFKQSIFSLDTYGIFTKKTSPV